MQNKNLNDLLSSIKSHLRGALWSIWNPIASVLYLTEELTGSVYSSIVSTFSYTKYKQNRTQRIVRKTVSSILHSQSNLTASFSNKRMAKFFTFLLQSVSFVTTYSGLVFFLGTVNPIAPLFVAIVVQGGCFYMLNNAANKKRSGELRRCFLICVLILISTMTSYIGIFNGAVKPIKILKTQYNSYVNTANNLISDHIKENTAISYSSNDIQINCQSINEIKEEAEDQYNIIKKQYDGVQTYTAFQGDNEVLYATNAEANNLKAELYSKMNEIQMYKNYLDKFVYDYKEVEKAYRMIEKDTDILLSSKKEKIVYDAFQHAIKNYRKLYKILNPETSETDEEIMKQLDMRNISVEKEIKDSLNEFKLLEYDMLDFNKSNQTETRENEIAFVSYLEELIDVANQMVVSDELIKAEEVRAVLKETIDDNYASLRPELSEKSKKKLDVAKNNATLNNTQTMPFVLPFTDKDAYLKEAIYSFIIALAVDAISVLISYVLISKKKSSLYFDKIGEMRPNREEMIEDCLMYICLNSLKGEEINQSEIENRIISKLTDLIKEFFDCIKLFYFPDELNAFGYIREADLDELNTEMKHLFITLQNTTMIQAFSQFEILHAISADFDENETENKEPKCNENLLEKYQNEFSENTIYYIVSKGLHVWICDNFTEILQNTLPSLKIDDTLPL